MDRGRRSMSWSPPKWRTESLRVEDVKRCLEAAKRLGSLTTQSSESSEINEECHSKDHTVGLRPVKFESDSSASAEAPQMNHVGRKSREEEHLHGSGWQDPICSLFQQEGGSWQDPICTLFQTSTLATCPAQNLGTGGSHSLETPFKGGDASYQKQNGAACVDLTVREQGLTGAPKPASQNMASSSSHFQGRHRENVFRDMGLPPAQIQRAIQTCGAQADDSIILQFPHDWRENKRQVNQNEFRSETKLATEENVSDVSLTVRQQIANSMRRNGAEELWDSDNSDYSENDEEQAVNLPKSRSPIDWAEAERGADFPVTLCKRELPNGEGHRRLMLNHGFHAELVERAIRELGEGVEYDMLLEYLLYLTAHEDPKASTSQGSLQKRANSAKEPGYPTKSKASSEIQVSTVEKLVAECGYPAKAVERAISICETPMWNAGQDQIADLVDFLTAHGGELNESEPDLDAKEDEDPHEVDDADWSWLRQHVVEDGRGKRKVGNVGAARRKTINRLSRPPHADLEDGLRMTSTRGKRKLGYVSRGMTRPAYLRRKPVNHVKLEELDELDEPSFRRRHNVKLEPFDELDIDTRDKPRRPARVKRQFFDDEPVHQLMSRRSQPSRVSTRIGRPAREVVPAKTVTLDRHHGSIGFGLPGNPVQPRYLDEDVKGAPFFYFENVASMPNDEWERIRRHLFDIEPEFVDSLHFSACRRPRGYIHNLPIEGRRKILKDPPMTIQELLPHTKAFWPDWDPRTKLNCITTRMGSEFLIKKLQIGDGTSLQTKDPSPDQQREILHLCRHWNLVWTAPNIPTPIDEIEIEAMLGFDPGHSRNILSNRSRYKALGNSFSVYTIAFHFSVLKPLFPRGIKLLSLFSGIGGAEVALHKMGIKLQVVVSVEIDDGTRRCLEAWWAASKQAGVLNQNYHNIKDLGRAQITELVNMYGGFDLIVGGTPCNNLSGSNHVTRVGLDGKQSTVFFEFSRVVAAVRELTIRLHQKSK